MRVLSVVGARPQFVKLAPVAEGLARAGAEHLVVHTGQHYDRSLSDVFFAGLRIPDPNVRLEVGSGRHGEQTGAMLAGVEEALLEHRPDWVLVYGDTNSTLAAAVAAVKLHIPVAHLEAGLRSFNRRMPEEHNRVLTDHAADLLLAPTDTAMAHLAREGLSDRSVLVGDVMADVCLRVRDAVLADGPVPVAEEPYLLATLHRAENTDDPERLRAVLDALAALPVPVRLLVHPRLRARATGLGLDLAAGALDPREPLDYAQTVAAVLGSQGVVTDSGGLQKETFLLERACTTLRTETEWPETLVGGWNVLLPDLEGLADVALRGPGSPTDDRPFGDGQAADAVARELLRAG